MSLVLFTLFILFFPLQPSQTLDQLPCRENPLLPTLPMHLGPPERGKSPQSSPAMLHLTLPHSLRGTCTGKSSEYCNTSSPPLKPTVNGCLATGQPIHLPKGTVTPSALCIYIYIMCTLVMSLQLLYNFIVITILYNYYCRTKWQCTSLMITHVNYMTN